MKYKFIKHFRLMWQILAYLSFAVVAPYFLSGKANEATLNTVYLWTWGVVLLLTLPAAILHLRYSVRRNEDISVVDKYVRLNYCKNKSKAWGDKNEIIKVVLHLPTSVYFKGARVLPSDSYYFGEIYTKNGKNFVITTLMDQELIKLKSTNVKFERRWTVYCWV